MLQVARLSPKLLGDSTGLVADFLRSELNIDGGFKDREGKSDLYYTVFGLEGLIALRCDLPVSSVAAYLTRFGDGAGLDFVHLACLARCWAAIPAASHLDAVPAAQILARLEAYRSADGGYAPAVSAQNGTVYNCFLALGAYQDLRWELPKPEGLLACLSRLETQDGGFANQQDMPVGLTPTSAAAATMFRHLGQPVKRALADWLLARCHPEGGFFAVPSAPMPDLLSTATALHALAGMQASIEGVKEPCLDFVDSLWTSRGGFYGNWSEEELDCEYTYYGLLALGHLSL